MIEQAKPSPVDSLISVLGGNPFTTFPYRERQSDLQGWMDARSILFTAIERLRPELIVEVGTWKGASTVAMAQHMDKLSVPGRIVCVDTWLGGVEHMLGNEENGNWLNLRWGWPHLYEQFLANVMYAGVAARIVPVPQTSHIAARLLGHLGLRPSLIYLDASHDFMDVAIDLQLHWVLLAPGGILVGDDYTIHWPGVIAAAKRHGRDQRLPMLACRGQYVFAKGDNPLADLCTPANLTCWDPLAERDVPIPKVA
ncbi:MAG: class I SAM-dependent methyltransferase [Alphaproteobacteria bacterium]|nr:class I SAM-dependent methyltransferase [Alphaproteobacteria bacterium]